ncbi:MAG: carboxypeptidase-like regulatory domain-containing protein, partial [archaeon]|nr:carboxypeptidase-like regulatory domain-containing protein [archaeon]
MYEEDSYNEAPSEGIDKRIIIAGAVIAILIIIAGIFFFLIPQGNGELTIKVENAEGLALWKAKVKITGLEETFIENTDRTGYAVFTEIPYGQEITAEASGKGFETVSQKFILNPDNKNLVLKLEPELENQAQFKTITFVGPGGVRLEGKLITAELSCSTGMIFEEPLKQVSAGSLDVDVPSGCGTLLANVYASGFEPANYNLDETSIVRLQELITEKGSATIRAEDNLGNFLENMEVTIKDTAGIPVGQKGITSFGEVKLDLDSGSYKAFVYDSTLEFAPQEREFIVTQGKETKIIIVLEEKPLATIKAKAINKRNNAEINAKITLEDPDGKKISLDFTNGFIEFPTTLQGTYKLMATADGYLKSEEIEISSNSITPEVYKIPLEACTPSTCGTITISVVDEEGLVVSNVRVALIDPATGFFLQEYGLEFSDVEGKATFTGLKSGTYAVLGQKFPAEGQSPQFEIIEGTNKEVSLEIVIGEGTIDIEAADKNGREIPFGFAEVINADGLSIGKIPLDAEGKGTIKLKADKKVFVKVETDGYTIYYSSAFQIYPQQITNIKAILEEEILGEKPQIEFLGLFQDGDREAKVLTAGNIYKARFKISVPTESNY